MAKTPVAGRVKTRLCPPCTHEQAAALAAAALRDTMAAAAMTGGARCVLALDGDDHAWGGEGFEVLVQRGRDLGERLAAVFDDVGVPALAIGMDTPQVTPALLEAALASLGRPDVDAVLGPATDGGYWAIGLRVPCPDAFAGVPMSAPDTGARQRARLEDAGLRVAELSALRDVDTLEDARAVAAAAPGTRFAAELAAIEA
jgi:rSAM/selenodomain-associated transferase 1